MKVIMIVVALSVAVSANVIKHRAVQQALPAIEHTDVRDGSGQFSLRYVTADGTTVSERGRLVPSLDGKGYVLVKEGDVSYIGDDGKTYTTRYTAGLDGTHVVGNHLPVAPSPYKR